MSSVYCHCNNPAVLRKVSKEGPNKGKQFYACAKFNGCRFFQWHIARKQGSTDNQNEDILPPYCPVHRRKCIKRQTQKGINQGRFYYVCPIKTNCNTFHWEDEWTPQKAKEQEEYNRTHGIDDSYNFSIDLQIVGAGNKQLVYVVLPDSQSVIKIAGNILEKIPGCIKETERDYKFPFFKHDEVKKALESITQIKLQVNPVPKVVIDMLEYYPPVDMNDDSDVDWSRLPTQLKNALMPFQRQGVIFGIKRNGKVLIGDEMGLGKTIQAIALSYYYRDDWPLLIICPSSLKLNWSMEIEKWLTPHVHSSDINIVIHSKGDVDALINIVSYDLAVRMKDKIYAKNFKTVVVDECHYLKNYKAQRTKLITPMVKRALRAIMITGTPALSRPIELFTQLSAVITCPSWFGNGIEFGMRYCGAKETAFGFDLKSATNLQELNYLLTRTVMVRRLKDDVLSDLPDKFRQIVHLQIPTKYEKQMKEGLRKIREATLQMKNSSSLTEYGVFDFAKNKEWMDMYKKTGEAKLAVVKEYLKDLLETGTKFIIFAHHLSVLDGIEQTVKDSKTKYIRIDGSTTPQNRQKYASIFQKEEDCKVAILSIQAAGVGLTLTPCSNVVFAELTWTPGALVQAEDRVHRIGQKNHVSIKYLLAKGTIDDHIWPMIVRKLDIVGETLDSKTESKEWTKDKVDYEGDIKDINLEDIDNDYMDEDYVDESEFNQKEIIQSEVEEQDPPIEEEMKKEMKQKEKKEKQKKQSIDIVEMFAFKGRGRKLPYNVTHDTKQYVFKRSLISNEFTPDNEDEESKERKKKLIEIDDDDDDFIKEKEKEIPKKKSTTSKMKKKPKFKSLDDEPKIKSSSNEKPKKSVRSIPKKETKAQPIDDLFERFAFKRSNEKPQTLTNTFSPSKRSITRQSTMNVNKLSSPIQSFTKMSQQMENKAEKEEIINEESKDDHVENTGGAFDDDDDIVASQVIAQELEESRRAMLDEEIALPKISSDLFSPKKKKRKAFLSSLTQEVSTQSHDENDEPLPKKRKIEVEKNEKIENVELNETVTEPKTPEKPKPIIPVGKPKVSPKKVISSPYFSKNKSLTPPTTSPYFKRSNKPTVQPKVQSNVNNNTQLIKSIKEEIESFEFDDILDDDSLFNY